MGKLVQSSESAKTTNDEKSQSQSEALRISNQKANERANVSRQTEELSKTQAEQQVKKNKAEAAAAGQREVACPFCGRGAKKKDVSGGKKEFKIPFTNPPLRIPIPPFIAALLSPDPAACSCGGKQTTKDVTDDTARYQQAKQKAEANIQKTIKTEAKLGTGGSRTSIIQSSETLYVGLGFNRNSSYEVVQDGHHSPGRMAFGGKNNKNGAAFFEGYKSNAVVGKQTSLGWPSANGNYSIKCANKYQLLTGAGGVTMATKGPVTISGGITTITGPQVTIGSSSGPLTLEGDVVSVTGKTISLGTTDANVTVKGTIGVSGNASFGGQVHAETLSFCKASCVGVEARTTTEAGNPDATQTFPAAWGGAHVTGAGITSSTMDIMIYMMNIVSEFETAAINLLSPTQMLNLANRFSTLSKIIMSLEIYPTGICVGIAPFPSVGFIWNYPHVHGLPSLNHSHAVTVPDIDYKNYSSPQALRAKVINKTLSENAPVVPSNVIQDAIEFALRLPGFAVNLSIQAVKLVQWIRQTII